MGDRAVHEPDGNVALSGQGADSGVSQAAERAGGLPLHPASGGELVPVQSRLPLLTRLIILCYKASQPSLLCLGNSRYRTPMTHAVPELKLSYSIFQEKLTF